MNLVGSFNQLNLNFCVVDSSVASSISKGQDDFVIDDNNTLRCLEVVCASQSPVEFQPEGCFFSTKLVRSIGDEVEEFVKGESLSDFVIGSGIKFEDLV